MPQHVAARLVGLHLSEPLRLWLYTFGTVVLAGLVLAGVLTEQWQTFGTMALAELLGLPALTELLRASVYAPRSLADAGLLDLGDRPGRHSEDLHRVQTELPDDVAGTDTQLMHRVPAVPGAGQ